MEFRIKINSWEYRSEYSKHPVNFNYECPNNQPTI